MWCRQPGEKVHFSQDLVSAFKATADPLVEVEEVVSITLESALQLAYDHMQLIIHVVNGITTKAKGDGSVPTVLPAACEGPVEDWERDSGNRDKRYIFAQDLVNAKEAATDPGAEVEAGVVI